MKTDVVTVAIQGYFRGERQEMYAILAFSLGLVLVAGLLHAAARDGFSRGFGVASLALAILLSSTAVSLAVVAVRRGAVVGAAAGLLLLVVAQWTIDHCSEARARRYAARLGEALASTAEGGERRPGQAR